MVHRPNIFAKFFNSKVYRTESEYGRISKSNFFVWASILYVVVYDPKHLSSSISDVLDQIEFLALDFLNAKSLDLLNAKYDNTKNKGWKSFVDKYMKVVRNQIKGEKNMISMLSSEIVTCISEIRSLFPDNQKKQTVKRMLENMNASSSKQKISHG